MAEEEVSFSLKERITDYVSKLKTTQIIVYGFLLVIIVGALLLSLPIASRSGAATNLLDAFFTSTSAVCVTGLVVVNTLEHWSVFGKIVILLLIQVGGLGFMSIFTTAVIFTGRKITLKERLVIQQSLNQNDLTGMVRLARNVVICTFTCEALAAFILSLRFIFGYGQPVVSGIGLGIFHAVSAFCNAGFDIIGSSSLMPYVKDVIISLTIIMAIILGGLGFAVWFDVIKIFQGLKSDKNFTFSNSYNRMSLHSKIVLEVSLFLIVLGTIFFFASEFNNPLTMGELNVFEKFVASLFQSVTPRTAGFNTISQEYLNPDSKLMTMILMFIGGSPGGTAGGVKTVTLSIIIISVLSVVKGKSTIESHNKSIPIYILQKSLAVVIMNLTAILAATMILCITERNIATGADFVAFLFEAVSAVGTVGLTLGITPYLSFIGKAIICICMFLGRLGPITVVVGLTMRQMSADKSIQYPEEKVIVG